MQLGEMSGLQIMTASVFTHYKRELVVSFC